MMHFKPSIRLTLVLFLLAVVFLRLGWWQLERKGEKQLRLEQFETAPALTLEEALAGQALFARVRASGQYDTERHILLDNQVLKGRPGVHVLTPFKVEGGTTILVNRGWLPMPPDRRSLPLVETDDSIQSITGRLDKPPSGGRRIGAADIVVADRWPQLVTYLEIDAVGDALGRPLDPWLVLLDPGDPGGFEGRQWTPTTMGPQVHGGYALQWFALALTALIIWIILGMRRARNQAKTPD